ncbi:hypothetical protein ACFLQN_00310 [Candidatus Aenigmatarchaeota archaeon]
MSNGDFERHVISQSGVRPQIDGVYATVICDGVLDVHNTWMCAAGNYSGIVEGRDLPTARELIYGKDAW